MEQWLSCLVVLAALGGCGGDEVQTAPNGTGGSGATGTVSTTATAGATGGTGGVDGAGGDIAAATTGSVTGGAAGTGGGATSSTVQSSSASVGGTGGTGGAGPCVPDAKRVFVTSAIYSGNLKLHGGGATGLESADKLCQLSADAEQLGGTWKAWLSDSATNAIDRIGDVGPWYLVDQCTKVFANKASIVAKGPLAPIDRTESGAEVSPYNTWTGTKPSGVKDSFTCKDWTNDQPVNGYEGTVGSSISTNSFWTEIASNPCKGQNNLYCFEQ